MKRTDATRKNLPASSRSFWPVVMLLGLLMILAGHRTSSAFEKQVGGFGGVFLGRGIVEDSSAPGNPRTTASLEQDSEIEAVVDRVREAVKQKRYDLATTLAQTLLDGSSNAMVIRERQQLGEGDIRFEIFGPAREEAEVLLARLPGDALRAYRLTADAEAQGLLAGKTGAQREQALYDVARQHFVTSTGDDAAYELACLMLDRHDFVGASRLFQKILVLHPDPNVTRHELLVRLAIALGRIQDFRRAREALVALERSAPPGMPTVLLAAARNDIDAQQRQGVLGRSNSGWKMSLGNPARNGHMPSLPASATSQTLVELWSEKFASDAGNKKQPVGHPAMNPNMRALNRFPGRAGIGFRVQPHGMPNVALPVESLQRRWEQRDWLPAGELLMDRGRVFFKTGTQSRCVDRSTFSLIFASRETAAANDATYLNYLARRGIPVQAVASSNIPVYPDEVVGFGDRLGRSMSLVGDVLYQLEMPTPDEGVTVINDGNVRSLTEMSPSGSRLAAYTAFGSRPNTGGKLLWKRGGDPDKTGRAVDIRFAAAPLPCGNDLVVPVRDANSLWLYGLSPLDGQTRWKTFLCDAPMRRNLQPLPVGIAVENRDVYIASGFGIVFCVDGHKGILRWATRYTRSDENSPAAVSQFAMMQAGNFSFQQDGWDQDYAIPVGRALLVLPSDAAQIFAFDRLSGRILWLTPKDNSEGTARYCLGVIGDRLFVAGKNCARCYSALGGKTVWEHVLDQSAFDQASHARGVLTADAVYLPVNASVLKLATAGGKMLAQVGVNLTGGGPVGNLYSDGQRLWSVLPDRVCALGPKPASAPAAKPTESR